MQRKFSRQGKFIVVGAVMLTLALLGTTADARPAGGGERGESGPLTRLFARASGSSGGVTALGRFALVAALATLPLQGCERAGAVSSAGVGVDSVPFLQVGLATRRAPDAAEGSALPRAAVPSRPRRATSVATMTSVISAPKSMAVARANTSPASAGSRAHHR